MSVIGFRHQGVLLAIAVGMLLPQMVGAQANRTPVDLGVVAITLSGDAPPKATTQRSVVIQVSNASNVAVIRGQYTVTLTVTRPGEAAQVIVANTTVNIPANGTANVLHQDFNLGPNAGAMTINAVVAITAPTLVDNNADNNTLPAPASFTITLINFDLRPTEITAPAGTIAGPGKTVTVGLINEGDARIARYTVTLLKGEQVVGGPLQGGGIPTGNHNTSRMQFPGVELVEGENSFTARVAVTGDQVEQPERQANNSVTQSIQVAAAPGAAPPAAPTVVNLGLAAITLQGDAPYDAGSERNIRIQISNPSAVAITSNRYTLSLRVTMPGQPEQTIAVRSLRNLPAGQTTTVEKNHFDLGAAAGALLLNATVTLNPADTCIDDDATNNSLAAPVTYTIRVPRIEIRPTAITIPAGTMAGPNKTVSVEVVNEGEVEISNYTITLRSGGQVVGQMNNGGTVAAGARRTRDLTGIALVEGDNAFEVTVAVTPGSRGSESAQDQANNVLTQSIQAAGAAPARIDIQPTQISASARERQAGPNRTVQVKVENKGDAGSTIAAYTVTLWQGGQVVGQPQSGVNLSTNDHNGRTLQFPGITLVDGENVFEARAEVTGNQTEAPADQANNSQRQSIVVVPAGAPAAPRAVNLGIAGITLAGAAPYRINTTRIVNVQVVNLSDVEIGRSGRGGAYTVSVTLSRPGQADANILMMEGASISPGATINLVSVNPLNMGPAGTFTITAVVSIRNVNLYVDNEAANNTLAVPFEVVAN